MATKLPLVVTNGQYEQLQSGIWVDPIALGSGSGGTTKFLREDNTWTSDLGSSTATTQSSSDNSTKIATTAFVIAAIGNLNSKDDVAYCSTTALPANTYYNGVANDGVGGTLTGNVNGPLIIDGITNVLGAVGQKYLIAGEASSANNGWYTLTQLGVLLVSPYILTRDVLSDQAAEMGGGYLTSVKAPNSLTPGSSNNGKVFISVAADPFTVGTTNITFSQVGGIYYAGNGIILSGSTFSLDIATAQTWTATQTQKLELYTKNSITASSNAATVPVTHRFSEVTNNSAATLTITITTAGAVDGQLLMVSVLDFSGVAQTITWVNTENSGVLAPTTSNGSTTLPLTIGFKYNSTTSKWRCIASA